MTAAECPVCHRPIVDHDEEDRAACKVREQLGDYDGMPERPKLPNPSSSPETAIGQAYRDAGRKGVAEAREKLRETSRKPRGEN